MNYDRELQNLIPVLNRLSNRLTNQPGHSGDSEPDSSQFMNRLEHLEAQIKTLKEHENRPFNQTLPINLARRHNNFDFESDLSRGDLNRTAPYDRAGFGETTFLISHTTLKASFHRTRTAVN